MTELVENVMVDKQQVFKQADNCLLEKMDDDILLYNPENTLTLHMNESSAVVWHLLDGQTSVLELINALQQQFPEAKQQIEMDVLEVLEKMLANKVILDTAA